MSISTRRAVSALLTLALAGTALLIGWRLHIDMQRARAHAAQGSVLLQTRCGPIEYQEAGTGVPLLAVHGSGGGHDQGIAFAGALAKTRHPVDRDVARRLPAHAKRFSPPPDG